jgi:serine/threonine-protein kinase
MQPNEIIKFLKAKDFVFLQDIGQGGTGNTKLIRDETINEDFICKKYSPFYPEHKALYYSNFVDEIKILYKINHPNIVRVFNYYLYPEQTTGFIIMEYIDGLDVENYIIANPDSINDIFVQTINGFKYLEERNILHRDIRPSNILVSNDGTVKIIDFGFGKNVESFEDYGKSITINWAYSLPKEFEEYTYDFKTELYFIGKLFEKIINNSNTSHIFKYSNLLYEMTSIDYNRRIESFFNVSRKITTKDSLGIKFEKKEKETYSKMANSLTMACSSVQYSTKYVTDFEIINKGLENLYQKSMLEEFIQNNSLLVSCFINPPYRYNSGKAVVPVATVYEFKEWFNELSENKKRVVLNNLWLRFDNIHRKDSDDLPF